MNNIISVLDTGYASFAIEKKLLAQAGYHLQVFPGGLYDLQGKIKFADQSVGLLIRWTEIDAGFLSQLPHLKAICRYGVGYDNIDLQATTNAGVKVANVRGYASHSVSDHTLALLFGVLREVKGSIKNLHTRYTQPGRDDVFELHQKTLGIIGLGRIGSTFARKASGLFKERIAYDPYISHEKFSQAGAVKVSLSELLQRSHVISIHCNLSAETHNLIDQQAFALMKQKPLLINTARGGIVNEEALKLALKKQMIYGVGIDVFQDEPPLPDMDEVIHHPWVIATGHNAWYSLEAMQELQARAASNLLALLTSQPCADQLC